MLRRNREVSRIPFLFKWYRQWSQKEESYFERGKHENVLLLFFSQWLVPSMIASSCLYNGSREKQPISWEAFIIVYKSKL